MVFPKDENIYDGFSQRLIQNQDDSDIQDMLLPNDKKIDKRLRRMNYLKLQNMKTTEVPNLTDETAIFGIKRPQPEEKEKKEQTDGESEYWWFWKRTKDKKENE